MAKSTKIVKRKPGRPRAEVPTEFTAMRVPKLLMVQIDKWAAKHGLDRSAAMRALIERGLIAKD